MVFSYHTAYRLSEQWFMSQWAMKVIYTSIFQLLTVSLNILYNNLIILSFKLFLTLITLNETKMHTTHTSFLVLDKICTVQWDRLKSSNNLDYLLSANNVLVAAQHTTNEDSPYLKECKTWKTHRGGIDWEILKHRR